MQSDSHIPDPWQALRQVTAARIALGRAGGSLPTREVLSFNADHALARDAVRTDLDVDRLTADLADMSLPVVRVASQAADRDTYLQRPDLGRRLCESDEPTLAAARDAEGCDVALIVADGLSPLACQRQAPALLKALAPLLQEAGFRLSPVVVATQARVGLQDSIGASLRARLALILIGERPGLGTPDSLGAYLVYGPGPGRCDADRNCVSNIRPEGLPIAAAARAIEYLIRESLRRALSGVALKDDRAPELGDRDTRLLRP